MVVLVVGPSGVGKSDYARHAQDVLPACTCLDLDALVSEATGRRVSELLPEIGNDAFLNVCREQIDALIDESDGGVTIVPVGAGALQSVRAAGWLASHPGPVIVVIDDPAEVYRRGGKRNVGRSLEQYIETEYSPHRMAIYGAASHTCDVRGLALDAARDAFVQVVVAAARDSGA